MEHAQTDTRCSAMDPILQGIERAGPGALVVVTNAADGCLGTLVRALLPSWPELSVLTDPADIAQLPVGGLHILRPRPDASGWVASMQATLEDRQLRLVVWLTPAVAEALDSADSTAFGTAPSTECPDSPIAHGVAGLLAGSHGPGVEWLGGPLRPTFDAAHAGQTTRWADATLDYATLVDYCSEADDDWLCFEGVDGQFTLRRLRWAMAEAGRWGRALLVEPEVCSPGWWPVHAQLVPLEQAADRLTQAGADQSGRLASLAGLEPEAIDLVEVLLATDVAEADIQAVLVPADDPGAALARLGRSRGLFTADDVVNRLVAPPIQRAFGADEDIRDLRSERFEKIGEQVLDNRDVPMDLLGSWATNTGLAIPVQTLDWSTGQATAWLVEAALRHGPHSAEDWRAIAAAAIRLGDAHVGARWADRALEYTDVDDITRSRALYTRARADYRLANHKQAEQRLRTSLEMQENILGPDHLEVARTLHAIGQALNRLKRYPQALATYNRALSIEKANLEPGHPDTAVTLHAIGQTLTRQGKYKEALESFQRDLRITRKQLGRDHPSLGPSLHSIGQTYTLMGREEYALACFAREIKILERALGKDHPDTAQARDAIGQVLTDMGRTGEAIRFYKRALAIKQAHLGEEHPETARTLYALGHTYNRQGDLELALDAFEQTVDIRRATKGPEHPYTALAWHALAQVYARKKEYRQAIGAYDQALKIKTKVLGPDHPETAITRFERGRALRDTGDGGGYTEMMTATGALVRELGPDHPMVKAAKQALR